MKQLSSNIPVMVSVLSTLTASLITICSFIITSRKDKIKMKIELGEKILEEIEKFRKMEQEIRYGEDILLKKIEVCVDNWDQIYDQYHEHLNKISVYLEGYMVFFSFFYKDKNLVLARKTECWELLYNYRDFIKLSTRNSEILVGNYPSIMTPVLLIRTYSCWIERFRLWALLNRIILDETYKNFRRVFL